MGRQLLEQGSCSGGFAARQVSGLCQLASIAFLAGAAVSCGTSNDDSGSLFSRKDASVDATAVGTRDGAGGLGDETIVIMSADGSSSCVPRTCQDVGYTCGKSGDGCGGVIDCGSVSWTSSAEVAGPTCVAAAPASRRTAAWSRRACRRPAQRQGIAAGPTPMVAGGRTTAERASRPTRAEVAGSVGAGSRSWRAMVV